MPMSVSAGRLDHERMYLWVHTGLVLTGIGLLLAPQSAGMPTTISPTTVGLLALALIFGSSLTLLGAAMGSPWFIPEVHDVRIPYAIAGCGQISVVAGLSCLVVLGGRFNVIGLLLAAIAITISGGCLHVTGRFIADVYTRSKILAEMTRRDAT
jgi:hypothetical protein